jgi:hypothetical protein
MAQPTITITIDRDAFLRALREAKWYPIHDPAAVRAAVIRFLDETAARRRAQ